MCGIFGAFGTAWDDAMVARWSANSLGMLWPEMDEAFASLGGNGGGPPVAARRPVVVVALVSRGTSRRVAPLVRGVEPTASVTIGKQFSTTSSPGPGAKAHARNATSGQIDQRWRLQ